MRTIGQNSTTEAWYFYVTNLQGDVVMLLDASGSIVAEYSYNAWGRILEATGTMADVNPIRYRGYYYDAETELYYLQSRYYDPEVGRFINADALASTGQGMLGSNMFAYCGNEPVNRSDSNGELYTPGQIHDFVLEDICNRDSSKEYKDTYMRYKHEIFRSKWYSYGFCDLYDTVTHEIWELKRINSGPTCTFLAAFIQVGYYVEEGEFVHRPEKNTIEVGHLVKFQQMCLPNRTMMEKATM